MLELFCKISKIVLYLMVVEWNGSFFLLLFKILSGD